MKPSNRCLDIIKKSEGFRSKPYLCPAGIPTIGYGSTRYENSKSVTLKDPEITETRAEELLFNTLRNYSEAVSNMVTVQLTQNQFDALVDFAYNAGISSLRNSTLLKLLNKGEYHKASLEFRKWVHAGGKVLQGLVARRKLEEELFNAFYTF